MATNLYHYAKLVSANLAMLVGTNLAWLVVTNITIWPKLAGTNLAAKHLSKQ